MNTTTTDQPTDEELFFLKIDLYQYARFLNTLNRLSHIAAVTEKQMYTQLQLHEGFNDSLVAMSRNRPSNTYSTVIWINYYMKHKGYGVRKTATQMKRSNTTIQKHKNDNFSPFITKEERPHLIDALPKWNDLKKRLALARLEDVLN